MAYQKPDYPKDSESIKDFLLKFEDAEQNRKYMNLLQKVADRQMRRLCIELDDVVAHFQNYLLCDLIEANTLRYIALFSNVIDQVMPSRSASMQFSQFEGDTYDIYVDYLLQRQHDLELKEQQQRNQLLLQDSEPQDLANVATAAKVAPIPKELTRRYEVAFVTRKQVRPTPLRAIRSKQLGKLVLARGIVTRVSDVKSELKIATYICDKCSFEAYQEVNSRQFMPLTRCPGPICTQEKKYGILNQQIRGSKFIKFQELKLQEMTEEVPTGSIPRSLTVHVRGELTRTCSPGDQITLAGVFLLAQVNPMRAMKSGPVATTYVEALNITRHKKRYDDYAMNEDLTQQIQADIAKPEMYSKLANSIAPEICGHEDVKKALMLMLVGGVTRKIENGVKIRGDINICLMGDPGVAKSQLLRFISMLSPRGIYTTGKGSSGVGLTAAVIKDTLTNELVLEGGALVLADNGVCCIDEFDKMDEYERTALHEVMEQQSISIAKAGIATTLNARSSVLAAANPAYGRYNPKKTPAENINLPPALLSRFDLLFLLLDKQNDENDLRLARHITFVHKNHYAPSVDKGEIHFDVNYMRAFVAHAKSKNPFIPVELTQFIAEQYVQLRADDARAKDNRSSYTTARTLLGVLRFSQALARLRFADSVAMQDITEAIRLMEASKSSLLDDSKKNAYDPITQVYQIIISKSKNSGSPTVRLVDVEPMLLARNLGKTVLQSCLKEYSELGIFELNHDQTVITVNLESVQ